MSHDRFHHAGRGPRNGNYPFPASSDRIDVDAFLGSLGESQGGTPDLSASILSRVHAHRPFVGERARLFRRTLRVGAAAVLCIGTLAFGGWLMDGGLEALSGRPSIAATDPSASRAFVNAMGRGGRASAESSTIDNAGRMTAAASAALSGFMRTTVPSQDRASTLADLLAIAAPMPAAPAARATVPGQPGQGPVPSGQTLASAALRWTQSVLPTIVEDEINEADFADQFDREFRGSRLESGTAGLYNPR
ncbi:MAG: hypothetical protein ACT4PL_14515 [Phycisphaerales bacterium]